MDTPARIIKHDGSLDAVFTHRTQYDTIAGTVWRFVLDGNKTLVVVPYQSAHTPAKAAHCVPDRIESVLGGGRLGFVAFRVATAGGGVESDWYKKLHEATEAEFKQWRARQKLPVLDQYDKDRAAAIGERGEKWKAAGLGNDTPMNKPYDEWSAERLKVSREVFKRYNLFYPDDSGNPVEPPRMNAVHKAQARLKVKREQIEARRRQRIEREKAAQAAEIEAATLSELGHALAAQGARHPGTAKLRELYDFIREDICQGNRASPVIRDANLRRVLAQVERLTGTNLTESVFLDYSPGMKAQVEDLAQRTAEAEKIEKDEARRRVLNNVRFVAVFEDGRYCPIESVVRCVHDQDDTELFQRMAPNEAARAAVNARLDASQREDDAQLDTLRRECAIKSLAGLVVTFAHAFTSIQFPFSGGAPLKLRATQKANVLQLLFENWKEKNNEWLAWPKVASDAGFSGADPDPYRHLKDRKNKRPEIERLFREIVERDKTPCITGSHYTVRLNPAYSYQAAP